MKDPNPPGSGKEMAEGKGVHREVESEGSRMWEQTNHGQTSGLTNRNRIEGYMRGYRTALVSSRLLHLRFRIPEYRGSISLHCASVKSVGYGLRVSLTFFMPLLCHFYLMKTSSKRHSSFLFEAGYALVNRKESLCYDLINISLNSIVRKLYLPASP